jgi:hypothetical protein
VLKELARRALVAREWFFLHGPPDAPALPLSDEDQSKVRYSDPLGHLVAEFARSLDANGWDINNHPSFEEFARGALASEFSPDFTRKNTELLKRFPPRPLRGLREGQVWYPPARRPRQRIARPQGLAALLASTLTGVPMDELHLTQ